MKLNDEIDVVALQEVRWKGKGEIRKSNFTLYFSGNEEKQGHKGVGFIVSKQFNKSVMGFTPVSDRLCMLKVKGKFHNMLFNNVYAPIEDADDEETCIL